MIHQPRPFLILNNASQSEFLLARRWWLDDWWEWDYAGSNLTAMSMSRPPRGARARTRRTERTRRVEWLVRSTHWHDPKTRDENWGSPRAEIAEGEPAREAVVMATIVEDSAAAVPHDAKEFDALWNNAAPSDLCSVDDQWLAHGCGIISFTGRRHGYYTRACGQCGWGTAFA